MRDQPSVASPLSLQQTLLSCPLAKTVQGLLFFTCSMGVYFWLQSHHHGICCVVTAGWADELLPFHHGWSWPYLMLYFLTALATACLSGGQELRAWWLACLTTAFPAWAAFYFFQTEYPRPLPDAQPWPWLYAAIIKADAPVNVTPCLHSAFALLSAWVANRTFARCRSPLALRIGLWALTGLVITSIVGIRQHRVVDILLSLPLAALGVWVFARAASHQKQ